MSDEHNDDRMADVLDAADKVMVESMLPEGAMPIAFVAIAAFVDAEGQRRWIWHSPMETSLTDTVGLLELTKHAVIAHQWGIEHRGGQP